MAVNAKPKSKGTRKVNDEGNCPPMTDQEILEMAKQQIADKIIAREIEWKAGDLMKILEIQKKLSTDKNAEDKFWQMIEEIRQEELKDAE